MGVALFVAMAVFLGPRQYEGQVLLSNGKPAAKAFLVQQSFNQGRDRIWSERIECDDQGRFSFPDQSPLRFQVHAYSSDLRESIIFPIQRPDDVKSVRLKPSAEVIVHFRSLGEAVKGTAHFQVMPNLNLPWVGDLDKNGDVRLTLPQGDYCITVRSDDTDFQQKNITFKAGKQETVIEGMPNPFRKLQGQPTPELTIIDSIGVPKTVSMRDYRGKYVLLEFWGFWCKPCVESSLPSLIQLRKANPGLESKLAILAVHENSGGRRTMEDIRKSLPAFERDLWRAPLPFPILLEKPASLTKAFGIRAYPTAVLIDPEGKVVDRSDADSLRQLLGLH